jgi:predicted metal-dependent phosphoesterase TrpH
MLSPDDAIDLQLHTIYSDGKWTPDALLDYLVSHDFRLAAITDHDRADTQVALQQLAAEKNFHLLVAVEMSSMWKGQLTDFLCYGFDPASNQLDALAQDVTRRQHENTTQVFHNLKKAGLVLPPNALDAMLAKPAAQQLDELVSLVTSHTDQPVGKLLLEAGFDYMTHPPAAIVEAAHQSGAVCILGHPGRSDGFVCYDGDLLDELRAEAPIDGIEAYYPLHSDEQTAFYLDYAARHDLLVTSGSDSHSPDKPPVAYPAHYSEAFLKRLGIPIQSEK